MSIDWTQMQTAEDRAATALAEARTAAEIQVCAAVDEVGDAIAGRYPRTERDTWPQQEVAARAWTAGSAEGCSAEQLALLTALATARGYPVGDLVPSIIAKADAWRLVGGALSGARGAAFEALAGCTTPEEIAAVLGDGLAAVEAIRAAAAS